MIHENAKVTPIPNLFIDDYLPTAKNPVFVLVYILAHRYFCVGIELSVKDAAVKLGILESDVVNAWKYWAENGLVEIKDFSLDSFEIEFLEVERKNKKKIVVKNSKKETTEAIAQISLLGDKPPDYSPDEMEKLKNADAQLDYLLKVAERLMAKPLTYNEMNALLGFYDWLKLPVEVIEVMLDYCISNGKKSMRYMEKVAIDWADNGISSANEAEDYIYLFNNEYRQIMKAFGHTRRDPNPKEMAYMKKWLRELNMPLTLVKEACDKTIFAIGQPKFSYADAILASWHNAEISSIDEVKALDEDFYKNMGEKSKVSEKGIRAATKAPTKNRFNNFEGRKRDYDKIFEMEQKLIAQSLDKK